MPSLVPLRKFLGKKMIGKTLLRLSKRYRVEEGAELLHGALGGRIRTKARKSLGVTSSPM